MALFSLSPAVTVVEIDNTLTADQIGDYIGGLAGTFTWGPVNRPELITAGETELVQKFGRPTNDNYLSFLVAADFLSYSPKAWISRSVGASARNAVPAGQTPVIVRNSDEAEAGTFAGIDFIAKYPGSRGNGIIVDIVDSTMFPSWEFAGNFDYNPRQGEFAVAVIDSTGVWTNAGAQNQTEKLVVNGAAAGGVRQVQTVTVSGTASGGIKQVEELTFTGASTGTTITVDGKAVTLTNGDSASTVAAKVAAVLNAHADYDSAVSIVNRVIVTFRTPGLRTRIFDVNQNGISVSSAIQTAGNNQFNIVFQGETIGLQHGDTIALVVDKIYAVFNAQPAKFLSVSKTTTAVTWTYVDYGAQTTVPSQVVNGVTLATAVSTAGNGNISLSIFGATVAIQHRDTSTVVASKIATALNAMGTPPFNSISADKNSVDYKIKTTGKKTPQAVPSAANGLTFEIDVVAVGRLGSILEKYELMSMNRAAKLSDGTTQFFGDAMANSAYVIVADKSLPLSTRSVVLQGGQDDNANVNLTEAYRELGNAEQYQINYLIAGAVDTSVQKAVYDVADTRKDCIAYASPQMADVVNNRGREMADVLTWRNIEFNRETSYGFNDDNWALVYDAYNDVNRWIPCCGGTAGLKARTDREQNPWDSPAGHENGRYKNYIRLAWSANKPQRDELYKTSVNSVVSFPGEGILLYGDKTSLTRPSAFRHVNVRSAFIVAEISLAKLAKYFLFKNNTPYTRAQFLNATRPLIRNMVAAGAFEDGKVIADERNNGPDVRRANQLVGTIKLIPNYSINHVVLYFEATAAGIGFEEIENYA